MVDLLSANSLFEPCPCCDTNVFVIKYAQGDKQFRCLWCDERFDPPEGSVWHGIDQLTDHQRSIYIKRQIRQMETSKIASTEGTTESAVKESASRARARLGNSYGQKQVTSD